MDSPINVANNVVFAPGSIYQVEVNAAGQGDKLSAGGVATISGGTVQVLAAAGNYSPSTSYTILSATGGVSGTFAGAIQVIGGNPLIGYANFFFEQAGLNPSDAFNSWFSTSQK